MFKVFGVFKRLKEEHNDLTILNSYKGLSIVNSAKIVDINMKLKTVSIKTNRIQAQAIRLEGKTFLNSTFFEKDIFAKVKYVDMSRLIVTLYSFIELQNSIRFRKDVRVKVDNHPPVELYFKDFSMTAPLLDISIHSIAIQIVKLRDELDLDTLFDIKFKLPVADSKELSIIRCEGEILKIIEEEEKNKFRVIIKILLSDDDENKILEFLSSKQKELIKEFKNNF